MSEQYQSLRSPFKFLDPYDRSDRDIFFGRNEEVELLYQYVNKNRLVLVYGQSGTGKTSLVQCGLANRFEVTDWVPFFIRRGKNIKDAFLNTLSQSKALGGASVQEDQLLDALERISARYLRPVYLIFDQFEELLILGDEKEQNQFLEIIETIINSPKAQSCNLLFILREEYFAWLDHFEKRIPGFSDRRLRVEPMRPNHISEVIQESCKYFHIQLEQPAQNAQQIIDSLSGKSGISLPYLQVYLDMLWREDFKRTYPDGWSGEGLPPLEFTTNEINSFGAIQDVLERFLYERRMEIQESLSEKHPEIEPDTVRIILDAFATEEGTKRPVNYTIEFEDIILASNAPETLKPISPKVLTDCLEALEHSRILRTDGETFELAHDSLAALIDNQRTDEQRQLNEIRRRLQGSYTEFCQTGEYLSRKQLNAYEDYLPKLQLDDHLKDYVEDSRIFIESKEKEEKERQQRELKLAKDKIIAEQRARRNQRRILILMIILAIAGVGGVIYFGKQNDKLNAARATLNSALYRVSYNLIRDSENSIYTLQHNQALPLLQESINTQKRIEETNQLLLEIAYFNNESNRFAKSIEAIQKLNPELLKGKKLENDSLATIRRLLMIVDSAAFKKLEARYYPQMQLVACDTFLMGCLEKRDSFCEEDERKIFPVLLHDYYIGKTEVTAWQYAVYCTASNLDINKFKPAWGFDGDNPMINVEWYDAIMYCNWLSLVQGLDPVYQIDSTKIDKNNRNLDHDKKRWLITTDWSANGYRLPTEAEWEYAAKGGKKSNSYLFSGSDTLNNVAWHSNNSYLKDILRPHPVGGKAPNELGLYDMSGNAWEWCYDWYGDYPELGETQRVIENPKGPIRGERWAGRVVRGGSWFSQGVDCRITNRYYINSFSRNSVLLGFRGDCSIKCVSKKYLETNYLYKN